MKRKDRPIMDVDASSRRVFFTSDLHFGHRGIIRFSNRPFSDTREMDEALIRNWNETVGKDDIVFDLGDFSFGSRKEWKDALLALNGEHHLILGNHDVGRYPGDDVMALFASVSEQLRLVIDGRYVVLNHYPFLCYEGTYHRGAKVWQLFGHVHTGDHNKGLDAPRLRHLFPYQYDVGVDNNNYRPVSWETVKEIIARQVMDCTGDAIPDRVQNDVIGM